MCWVRKLRERRSPRSERKRAELSGGVRSAGGRCRGNERSRRGREVALAVVGLELHFEDDHRDGLAVVEEDDEVGPELRGGEDVEGLVFYGDLGEGRQLHPE
jgi:hypothetical protein